MLAGHILERQDMRAVKINKNKFKDETPKHHASSKFLSVKIPTKTETRHCVQVPYAIAV